MAINFDELMTLDVAESMSFDPLPKGQYKAAVDACELGESKKGKAMYTIDFVVTEGEHAARQIRYWLVLQTKKGLHWDLPKSAKHPATPGLKSQPLALVSTTTRSNETSLVRLRRSLSMSKIVNTTGRSPSATTSRRLSGTRPRRSLRRRLL